MRMDEKAFEYAIKILGLTEDEIKDGLALHEELYICDSFGFLPNTRTPEFCEKMIKRIKQTVNMDDILADVEVSHMKCIIEDEKCNKLFKDAIKTSGIKCDVLTVGSEKNLEYTLERISGYTYLFDNMKDILVKAVSVKDLDYALSENKLAVIWSTNAAPADGGISHGKAAHTWIERLYRYGMRVMHLTYNRRNWIGDGCLEPANAGLSLHGRDVIKQLNELGIIIDIPHSGLRTTIEAAELSQKPIAATHTACRGVYNHPRAKTDEALKAIAASGGYVGICLIPHFLGENASINTLLDHIEYAVELIGIDHVGIGSDVCYMEPFSSPELDYYQLVPFHSNKNSWVRWYGAWEYSNDLPEKIVSPEGTASLQWTNWPLFTAGLMKRGYSKEEISKIAGGNFIRVFKEVCV
ncbi:MAG: hypothetical protein A2017_10895 [Lentisphaerae bacterium GWF2_44_16]|nr:MAG: hypothetical protein A2017_10895 [Lentisphaerae bacterium GWF2_44_16]